MVNITDNPMEYDVQSSLKKHMPGLIELLGTQNISWTSINKKLDNNLQKIKDELNLEQNTVLKEATFYSIIINSPGRADGMFDWFHTVFESLLLNLTPNEKMLICKTIYSILAALDKGYLNFMGELATLNEIKILGKYDLINTEEPIQSDSKRCADFLFLNKDDNSNILVEVVNIHLYLKAIEGNKNIKQFIDGKLKGKMRAKFIKPKYDFYLQPVIWIKSEKEHELLVNLYKDTGLEIDNVEAPLVYFTYQDLAGKYEHHFDCIY